MNNADYNGLAIGLRSVHGFQLCAAGGNGRVAQGDAEGPFLRWQFIDLGDGTIALQSEAHRKFLCGVDNRSVVEMPHIQAWEKWRVIDHGDGTISLQRAHGRFLRALPHSDIGTGMLNAAVDQQDAIGPWEKWSIINKAVPFEVTGLQYSLNEAQMLFTQPVVVGEATARNNTSIPQNTQLSFSEEVEISSMFSQTTGLSVGASVSIQAGIPEVFESQIQVSTEFRRDWTVGAGQAVRKAVEITLPVAVPPFSAIVGRLVARQTRMTVPWTALARYRGLGGAVTEKFIGGVWEGTSVWDVQAEWAEVQGA
jgi:hypothetical protein